VPDDALLMVLEPTFGDEVLRLADVQKLREPALASVGE
jgi:hypothetical protein